MKKMKMVFCGLLFSTCLAGNSFAADLGGYGVLSLIDSSVNAVIVALWGTDTCEGRICTTCKPTSDGSDGGNCRPTP